MRELEAAEKLLTAERLRAEKAEELGKEKKKAASRRRLLGLISALGGIAASLGSIFTYRLKDDVQRQELLATQAKLVFRRANNYTYAHPAFFRRFFGFVHPGEISSSR